MHRSITTVSPCSRAYAAAGSFTTPDCIQSAFAPAATASSATGITISPLRNTSTTSTPSGTSCTRPYGSSPSTGPSRFGLTGKILNPKPCSARAMAWLVRCGLSERPTTATVRAPDRRFRISSGPGFWCISPPTLGDGRQQRREGQLLAFCFDHHVGLPPGEGVEERGPVFRLDGVGVGAGTLRRVLAREVDLRPHPPRLPSRQRQVERLAQRESARVQAVVKVVHDRGYTKRAGRADDLLHRPDALVVFEREVAPDALLRPQRLDEAVDGGRPVVVGAAEVQHDHGVFVAHEVEDTGGVARLVDAAFGRLGVRAPGVDKLARVHAQPDA